MDVSHTQYSTMAMTRQFGEFSVRMKGTPEHPLFCVKDVCDALGIVHHRDKTALLKDDEKLAWKGTVGQLLWVEGPGGGERKKKSNTATPCSLQVSYKMERAKDKQLM